MKKTIRWSNVIPAMVLGILMHARAEAMTEWNEIEIGIDIETGVVTCRTLFGLFEVSWKGATDSGSSSRET